MQPLQQRFTIAFNEFSPIGNLIGRRLMSVVRAFLDTNVLIYLHRLLFYSSLKDNLCIGDGPYWAMAARCSFVGYPLCFAKPY